MTKTTRETIKTNDYAKYLGAVDEIEQFYKDHVGEGFVADRRIFQNMRIPHRFIRSSIYLHRGNWIFEKIWMGRCQHSQACGPAQGGEREEESANEDTNLFLAGDMSLKNAIARILHGGGKGVISFNKFSHTELEKELVSRGFITVLEPYIGPYVDGIAGDKNVGEDEMSWQLDQLERIRGYHNTGAFTCKPLVLGGSLGRLKATGRGAAVATREMIKYLRREGEPLTFGVDGYGNAATNFIDDMQSEEFGKHICVAVSDTSGFIAKKDGLPIKEIYAFCHDPTTGKKIRKVTEYALAHPHIRTGKAAIDIYMHADFGAPAASQNRIDDRENWETREDGKEYIVSVDAHKITWLFGVELANGPCTKEAIKVFALSDILILADIFSSMGGVRSSSGEKSQGLANARWTQIQADEWLEAQVVSSFKGIMELQAKYHFATFRQAANIYAGIEIVKAMKARGGLYLPYGRTIDAMPLVVSATPHAPEVLLKKAWVVLTNLDKLDTLLLRSVRRWLRPILAH